MELQRAKDATISILSTWWPKPLTNIPNAHTHTHTQHMHSQSITFDRNDNYTNRSNIFETVWKKRFRYKWFECTPYNCINMSRVSPDSYSVMCIWRKRQRRMVLKIFFCSDRTNRMQTICAKKNEQTSNIFCSRAHLYCASHSKNSYPLFILSCLLPFSVHFVAYTTQ